MSKDQRPARVRVIDNRMAPVAPPQRRRTDPVMPLTVVAAVPARRRFLTVIGAILFLIGCAAGGALVTISGLFGMMSR